MKVLLCIFLFISSAFAQTKLLLIGGGKRPPEAMKAYVELAGADKADILVIPWASESIEGAEAIKAELAIHGKVKVEIVPHRLAPKDLEKLNRRIETSSGIFFTGGDQNTLMSLIRDYKLADIFKKKFQEGTVFGGTSAGTAIMSNPMLTGKGDLSVIDGSQIELTEGLGLLPEHVIVDQHFIVRSRFNRLAGVILNQNQKMGIAVDENTSLLIKGRGARVIGPTQVLIFKKTNQNKLEITVLEPNQTINL